MLGLTSQRRSFDVVISDLKRCGTNISDFTEDLCRFGFIYYLIVHDKDVDNQGSLIRPHIHVVLVSSKTLRVKQLLNLLSDSLDTNIENIQVQEVVSLPASIQYLIHLNDCNKYQYSKEFILTNDHVNIDSYLLENTSVERLTTERLFELVVNNRVSRLELVRSIGIGAYQHYRGTIDDLYKYSVRK